MIFIKKNLKWITIIFVLLILVGIIGLKKYLNGQAIHQDDVIFEENTLENTEVVKDNEIDNEVKEIKKVFIDIKGAVINPGVYEMEEDKKVIDAVQLAGGFSDNANTTLINLAKKIKNEMVIIIYTNDEVEKVHQEKSVIKIIDKECVCPQIKNDACLEQNSSENFEEDISSGEDLLEQLINLNTATKEELEKLPGIGASKADAIITHREEVGEFGSIDELKDVKGIGESLYEKIKDYITV